MKPPIPSRTPLVGRCVGCFHDFTNGPCGGCGAVDDAPSTTGGVGLVPSPGYEPPTDLAFNKPDTPGNVCTVVGCTSCVARIEQARHDAAHSSIDWHCLNDPCEWHPAETRIHQPAQAEPIMVHVDGVEFARQQLGSEVMVTMTQEQLAAHDAAVKAEALRELADDMDPTGYGWRGVRDAERFRARIRERADRLTRGGDER